MRERVVWVILLLLMGGTAVATPAAADRKALGPGTHKLRVEQRFKGIRRSYLLHAPEGGPFGAPLPLVVVLHGAFSTARKMEQETGFSRLADREHFYAAYPNGIGVFGLLQHWNAGHCCGKAAKDGIDDVGFVEQVIEHAARTVDVDRSRVYVVGFSNGGMLAYRFAAERPGRVAAAAALGASIGGRKDARTPEWRIPPPERPTPIIIFHGLADGNVPFAGGRSPVKGGEREYVSVEESVAFWVRTDGCSPDAVRETQSAGWVAVSSFPGGREGSEVVFYTLREWGHQWPGTFFTEKLAAGHPLRGFDATEIIWGFFKRHSRPGPPSADPRPASPRGE